MTKQVKGWGLYLFLIVVTATVHTCATEAGPVAESPRMPARHT